MGSAILAGSFAHAAFATSALLFTAFAIAQFVLVLNGSDASCGCFGVHFSQPVSLSGAVAAASLAVLSLICSSQGLPTRCDHASTELSDAR